MTNPTNVGDNPNDKMPEGKPLHPDTIVSEDDAGSAAIEAEAADENDAQVIAEEFEGLDNDLVNVGKFSDPAAEDGGLASADEDEDQPGLPGEPALDRSNTLQKP